MPASPPQWLLHMRRQARHVSKPVVHVCVSSQSGKDACITLKSNVIESAGLSELMVR